MFRSMLALIPQVWLHPRAAFRALKTLPAPRTGLAAILTRGLFISLFTYLPAWLMGRQPAVPSAITTIPTEGYFGFLAWFSPIFFLAEWLLFSGIFHLVLRLLRRQADIDAILNTGGVIDLAAQPLLTAIDWLAVLIFPGLPAVVGFAHLALVMAWVTWLSALGYREALGLPCWAGALFCVAASILHFPLALLFMRPI